MTAPLIVYRIVKLEVIGPLQPFHRSSRGEVRGPEA